MQALLLQVQAETFPTNGLVAYWAMRNSGTTVYDEYGAYNGTAAGGVTFGTEYAAAGYGASFDGTDDYIGVGDHNALSFVDGAGDKPFSILAWVNLSTEATSSGAVFSKDQNTGTWTDRREYLFIVRTAGNVGLTLNDKSDVNAFIDGRTANGVVTLGAWHHIAATYDGSKNETGITIYVDGVDRTGTRSETGTYTGMENTATPAEIGRRLYADSAPNSAYFLGEIDEVAIWSRALTSNEVYRIATTPLYYP
jgi:hypothetical protein